MGKHSKLLRMLRGAWSYMIIYHTMLGHDVSGEPFQPSLPFSLRGAQSTMTWVLHRDQEQHSVAELWAARPYDHARVCEATPCHPMCCWGIEGIQHGAIVMTGCWWSLTVIRNQMETTNTNPKKIQSHEMMLIADSAAYLLHLIASYYIFLHLFTSYDILSYLMTYYDTLLHLMTYHYMLLHLVFPDFYQHIQPL